ncbi:hypothetical protein Tco_1457337, partial [Tanacetum coccineum]
DTELETLIATYDIPLDLRPNFRMSILPAGDTSIGIEPTVTLFRVFQTLSKQGDWFSFAKRGGSAPVYVDRTTSPAPAGTAIPRPSLEEIAITRPDRKVVTKADHTAKRKASTRPEISTNAAKKTRSSKKVAGSGFSGLAAGDEVEHTDDGALDDGDQRDGSEFAMEDIENLNDVNQGEHINIIPLQTFDPSLGLDVTYPPILFPDKEVEAHAELSRGVRRATQASFYTSHANVGADEIASDGNVDPYYEARVSNTARDVLERDLLPFVSGPYCIPYPYDEGSGSESPPYTIDDWEEIHGVNLGLQKKELYKDPKVCRTALDRFPTPAETHRLRELYSVELSDRISCVQQTQTIKKQRVDLKQQSESTIRANEEVSRLKAELGALKSKCKATEQKLSSWDKKHRKYKNERVALVIEKEKIETELVGTKSQLEHPISVGVERGLRMDRTDEEFRGLSQKVVGFIPDAKEKFDRVIAAFPNATFPFLNKTSSAAASLRANTHIRHSTSSSKTFGHTSTPEHLKKKKKSVEKGGPSAA